MEIKLTLNLAQINATLNALSLQGLGITDVVNTITAQASAQVNPPAHEVASNLVVDVNELRDAPDTF